MRQLIRHGAEKSSGAVRLAVLAGGEHPPERRPQLFSIWKSPGPFLIIGPPRLLSEPTIGLRKMNHRAFDKSKLHSGTGPNGRPLCRWCGTETQPPRRTWCSKACDEAFKMEAWPSHRRYAVWRRDHGVCVQCGVDTEALKQHWRNLRGHYDWEAFHVALLDQGFDPHGRVNWWDADHILPMIEGGGNQLSNLRTLCQPCHKAETARLAGRRKKPK